MSSKQADFLFDNSSFDFVYIDAGHEYEDIKMDYLSWIHKVRCDGIIAGHDYSPVFPGVVEFVDLLKQNHDIKFTKGDEYEGVNYESWYYIK
ncbi:MAG: class I SAM-dependent methyltransferase [Saprospiraceae bacterium]|nr:class I SAM-dependent methyltransferase [Saprospiraceae bacterium]